MSEQTRLLSADEVALLRRRARAKKTTKSLLLSALRHVFLISIAYVLLYPLFFMLSTSIKGTADFTNPSVVWLPHAISAEGFRLAIDCLNYGVAALSTVKYEIVSALLEVASCALAAYGLARYRFRGKKILMVMLILTILVPEQMTIVPKVVNYSQLDFLGIIGLINRLFGTQIRINILNTGLCFWLPSLFGVGLRSGVMIYIYIQFFKGLPKELEEAAWIDGATPLKTFLRIVIPSSTVVIFTVTIFSVIWHYNDYYLAVMYINRDYPLAVGLTQIQSILTTRGYWDIFGISMSATMAACVLFVAPMLILYILLQRKFIQSIDKIGITG